MSLSSIYKINGRRVQVDLENGTTFNNDKNNFVGCSPKCTAYNERTVLFSTQIL